MDFDKQSREGEPCRGVMKELFTSERYGFAGCECAKHTGGARSNFPTQTLQSTEGHAWLWSDGLILLSSSNARKPTTVTTAPSRRNPSKSWSFGVRFLKSETCTEFTGKVIHVTRNKYNGRSESEAVTRRDTCRAAVTWEQMKQNKTFALHCNQDTVSSSTGSPYSSCEPIHIAPSPGYTAELLPRRFCNQSDVFSRGDNEKSLVSSMLLIRHRRRELRKSVKRPRTAATLSQQERPLTLRSGTKCTDPALSLAWHCSCCLCQQRRTVAKCRLGRKVEFFRNAAPTTSIFAD